MTLESVIKLITAQATVSSVLAENPKETPVDICKKLYGDTKPTTERNVTESVERVPASAEDLAKLQQTFNWGPQPPSEFFLRVFHDSLQTLAADPLGGMVSPPLMGSHGTIPLSVIAPLADIFRHISNLIVRAEKEVIIITCSWSPSLAQRFITEALKELSRRAGQRNERVVVKVMYDKAGTAQLLNPRQTVHPDAYSGQKILLPHPSEIPHLDFEVTNFHKPVLGTLHAKFAIIDRKIAVIQSNNTEDNDNMEMMTHVEGPIVDSLYDTAIITWGNEFRPALPSVHAPAAQGGIDGPALQNESLFMDRGPAREQQTIIMNGQEAQLPEHMPDDPHYDNDMAGEITRMQSAYSPRPNESRLHAVNKQLNLACKKAATPSGPEIDENHAFTPYIPVSTPLPVPMAVVSRLPYGNTNNHNVFVPQNEAWLSSIRNAKRDVFIQTPDLNATPLHEAMIDALRRGVEITYYVCFGYNDAGELMPGQGGTNEMFATNLIKALTPEEVKLLNICYYVGKDQDHPIHNSFKQRSCHVKLLIADGHIGIQGSGNQDTQSWYHSQEINILIDSEEVCRKWREGIERNQNTAKFGKADMTDGIWRDSKGETGEGMTEEPSSKISGYIQGVKGMAKKLHNKGGF